MSGRRCLCALARETWSARANEATKSKPFEDAPGVDHEAVLPLVSLSSLSSDPKTHRKEDETHAFMGRRGLPPGRGSW